MAKKDRTGNRKTREQRKQFKVSELGYYLIVTDTEATERCFFTGLHQALPEDVRNKLVIKVVETKTRAMIDKCLELTAYDAQYRIPWIVFDDELMYGKLCKVGDDCLFLDCISREADKESCSRRFAYYSWNGVAGEVWV